MNSLKACAGAMVVMLMMGVQTGLSQAQQGDGARLRQLEEELGKIREEVDALKKERPKEPAKFPIDFGASITIRYDYTKVEDQTDLLLDDNTTEGFRTRDRFWAKFEPDGPVNAGLRLTTGGDSKTSPFVRLGDLFQSKSFRLDQLYITVHPMQFFDNRPRSELPADLSLHFGKIPQPFWLGDWGTWASELIWDQDVNPEGVAVKLSVPKAMPMLGLEGTVGYFILQEVTDARFSGLTGDAYLVAGQLKLWVDPATLAFTFYNYDHLNAGLRAPNFSPGSGAFLAPGEAAFLLRSGIQHTNNQLDFGPGAIGFVKEHFQVINLTGQVHFAIPVLPALAPEIFLVGDYVNNLSLGRDDQGYGLTLWLRGGGKQGSGVNPFSFWFTYRNVDADATLAASADSDLGAGTAYRGFEVAANYRLHRNLLFQISGFHFEGFPNKDNTVSRIFFDLIANF